MSFFDFKSETHATKLLIADHREVDALFTEFESADDSAKKASIVTRICRSLTVHAEIEEKIFYPESRRVLDKDDQDMVDEAFVEHASLKGLIMRLDGMKPGDALFGAYVTVLKEYVQHHVKEEESEYFPKVEKTGLDLDALGARMKTLKDQLMAEMSKTPMKRGQVVAKLLPSVSLERRAGLMRKAA
ncbi:hemerythrin domain-containing protein [Hydrocarboniphaga sp.]|uniref:hemerythrin domain-containing protein n=1 Tax=Hydrocarboniphaga sp. TaxID=2033016 RepID=UPI003D1189CE